MRDISLRRPVSKPRLGLKLCWVLGVHMKANRWAFAAGVLLSCALAACSSGPRGRGPGGPGDGPGGFMTSGGPGGEGDAFGPPGGAQREAAGLKLKQFDIDADGKIPVEELDVALKKTFARFDINHDNALEPDEAALLTTARRMADPNAEELHDWNKDNVVDLGEFAAEWRTLFQLVDADRDDTVTDTEMKAPLIMPGGRTRGGPGGPGGGPGGGPPGGGPGGGGR